MKAAKGSGFWGWKPMGRRKSQAADAADIVLLQIEGHIARIRGEAKGGAGTTFRREQIRLWRIARRFVAAYQRPRPR